MKTFNFYPGNNPILVSMPHNGTSIPAEIATNMTASALKVVDTDWYMDRIYSFTKEMGCNLLDPLYSRYVIDLNRPNDNQSLYPGSDTTELCPTTQFDKAPIYLDGKAPDDKAIAMRIKQYWIPYHQQIEDTLTHIKNRFGFAILFEAHSIKSKVPRFFDGQLPDFNFGTYNGLSCSPDLTQKIEDWQPLQYSKVVNGRFKGGYITRHYGNPAINIESIQLELSQATYLNEELLQYNESKAQRVIEVIRDLFSVIESYCIDRVK